MRLNRYEGPKEYQRWEDIVDNNSLSIRKDLPIYSPKDEKMLRISSEHMIGDAKPFDFLKLIGYRHSRTRFYARISKHKSRFLYYKESRNAFHYSRMSKDFYTIERTSSYVKIDTHHQDPPGFVRYTSNGRFYVLNIKADVESRGYSQPPKVVPSERTPTYKFGDDTFIIWDGAIQDFKEIDDIREDVKERKEEIERLDNSTPRRDMREKCAPSDNWEQIDVPEEELIDSYQCERESKGYQYIVIVKTEKGWYQVRCVKEWSDLHSDNLGRKMTTVTRDKSLCKEFVTKIVENNYRIPTKYISSVKKFKQDDKDSSLW